MPAASSAGADADERAQRNGANRESQQAVLKERALRPVVRDVARVPLDDGGVLRFLEVKEHVAELNRPETRQTRAVRIAFFVGEGVVLAMDGDPLLRGQAGRQPQREPEEPGHRRVQRERAVRRGAMQVDGRAEDRHLNQDDGDDQAEYEVNRALLYPPKAETLGMTR